MDVFLLKVYWILKGSHCGAGSAHSQKVEQQAAAAFTQCSGVLGFFGVFWVGGVYTTRGGLNPIHPASPNKGRRNLQLKCLCMGGWGQVRAIGQGPPQSFSLMHAQIYKSPQNVYGALMGIDKTFDSF